ncbi:MAG: HD domain-containing protein [Fimbriimonadaceae bacterium]|nr:HD domain-containing protein [Chitinophagales bacterium]
MNFVRARKYILERLKNDLPPQYHYHSIDHTKDVLSAAKRIAKREGISGDDLILLKTAVLYHDAGFIIQSDGHEKIGCGIAKKILPVYNYNSAQINKICGMIMATKIPQQPHNLLEEIICDADLDYLGRNDYSRVSNFLFLEMSKISKVEEIDWLKIQVSFLKTHKYFTKTSIAERNEKKQKNLQLLTEKLNKRIQ